MVCVHLSLCFLLDGSAAQVFSNTFNTLIQVSYALEISSMGNSCAQTCHIITFVNMYIIKIRNAKKYAKITPSIKHSTITSAYCNLQRSGMAHQNP